jgi:hypothetical protein
MNRPKPIKPFKTLEEEANFWDTHDVSLFVKNPKIPLSRLPLLEKEKKATMTLRLQKSTKKKLEAIARSKGINSSTLTRIWINERLQREFIYG